MPDTIPTDKNGRPLVGSALAAFRRAEAARKTQAADELPFARHRGGAEAPPWRR